MERGSATRSSLARQDAFGIGDDVLMFERAAAHRAALQYCRDEVEPLMKSGGENNFAPHGVASSLRLDLFGHPSSPSSVAGYCGGRA